MWVSALAFLGLLALATLLARLSPSAGWRGGLLRAAVWYGALAALSIELLSPFLALIPLAIQIIWIAASLGMILTLAVTWKRTKPFPWSLPDSLIEWSLLGLTTATLLIALVICLVSPPNGTDSQIYHLPRMMQWRQNQTVAFFPTHIIRELHTTPFAEYAALHTIELTGSDRLVNLVQWFSLVGCGVAASFVARQIGAGRVGQAFAGFAAISVPTSIVQVAGGKNDIVASFWSITLVFLVLTLREQFTVVRCAELGLAIGLAMLTKLSSGLLLVVPLGLLILPLAARIKSQPALMLGGGALSLVLAVGVMAPHGVRNQQLFGSPFGPTVDGPTSDFTYGMRSYSLPALVSNIARNTAYEMGTPWEPVNQAMFRAIVDLHTALAIELNDKRTTWPISEFTVPRVFPHDEWAPNPVHTSLIILIALIATPLAWRSFDLTTRSYLVGLGCSFILFCLLLRWQWSNVRYLLPLTVMWTPVFGLIADKIPRPIVLVVTLLLAARIWPAFSENSPRSIEGDRTIFTEPRLSLYSMRRPEFGRVFGAAAEQMRSSPCREFGVVLGWDDFEYPLWAHLMSANIGPFRIGHVQVQNVTSAYPQPGLPPFQPCLVMAYRIDPTDTVVIGDVTFDPAWLGENTTIYRPRGEAAVVRLPYSAAYASAPPQSWTPGQTLSYEIELTNSGAETWSTAIPFVLGIHFGQVSDEPHESWETDQRIKLPRDLVADETISIPVQVKAPDKEGVYVLRHRLFKEGTFWFSQIQKTQVTVARPPQGGQRSR